MSKRETWSPEELDQMKDEIIACLKKHEMWMDTSIYVNGNRYSYKRDAPDQVEVEKGLDPRDYFEYVRSSGNILSMSFEGPLYEALNYYNSAYDSFIEEFQGIFRAHDLYFEQGHAWNLSCYPI